MNDREFVSTAGTRHRLTVAELASGKVFGFARCDWRVRADDLVQGKPVVVQQPVKDCKRCYTDEAADVERRVRELLAEAYTPVGVEMWLNSVNRNLGESKPVWLLAYGDEAAEDVLREAERVAGAL